MGGLRHGRADRRQHPARLLRRSRCARRPRAPGRRPHAVREKSRTRRKARRSENDRRRKESHVPQQLGQRPEPRGQRNASSASGLWPLASGLDFMATKVFMEALSPTMEEGRLVKWAKAEGDAVKSGDVLAEVETDKAIMELVARGDGILRKRLLDEGGTSPVGTLIAVIAGKDEDIESLVAGASSATPAAAPAPSAPAPSAPAAPAPSAMGMGHGARGTGETPVIQAPSPMPHAQPPAPPAPPPRTQAPAAAPDASQRTRSSPLARRLAAERGVDLASLGGSGPGGRIIKRDVEGAHGVTGTPASCRAT